MDIHENFMNIQFQQMITENQNVFAVENQEMCVVLLDIGLVHLKILKLMNLKMNWNNF